MKNKKLLGFALTLLTVSSAYATGWTNSFGVVNNTQQQPYSFSIKSSKVQSIRKPVLVNYQLQNGHWVANNEHALSD